MTSPERNEYIRKWLNDKYTKNPEFREKVKERSKEHRKKNKKYYSEYYKDYNKARYQNDPEYKEKRLAQARAYYQRKKAKKGQENNGDEKNITEGSGD